MAVTLTPRLGLKKQSANDPTWDVALNAGFDNADARILKFGAPNPNLAEEGHFVGQLYYQITTTPHTVWICRSAGTPGAWDLLGQLPFGYVGVQSSIVFNNNIALRGKTVAAAQRDLAKVDVSDQVVLGDPAANILVKSLGSNPHFDSGSGVQVLWHSGNDGPSSGLDADTVDGLHAVDFVSFAAGSFFDSGQLAVPSAAAILIAHSLGAVPRNIQARLECVVADASYPIGTSLLLTGTAATPSDSSPVCSVFATNTNLGLAVIAGGIRVVNNNGVGSSIITDANWRVRLLAWK